MVQRNAGAGGFAAVVLLAFPLSGALGGADAGGPVLPEAVRGGVVFTERLPRARYSVVKQWEAEDASHRAGHLVKSPEASGGAAWEALPGQDLTVAALYGQTCILYGPYIELPPGPYAAFIRIRLDRPWDGLVGTADACVGFGKKVLAWLELPGPLLPVGRYVEVPLAFRYPGGKLECRLTWRGQVGLRADRVTLCRIEGEVPPDLGRAQPASPTGRFRDLVPAGRGPRGPDIFPRAPTPAPTLRACDLRKASPDLRLAVFCLQGLVNRTRPEVYCIAREADARWLDHLRRRGWIRRAESVGPEELFTLYRERVRGAVVFSDFPAAARNVATMVAAARDGVACTSRLQRRLNLPVIADLRGRWKTNTQAYRWAFENLWPQMSHRVLACLWPHHLALRDYLVANRVFIFWISGPLDGAQPGASPQSELEFAERLLAATPPNTPILGYPWAGPDVGIGEGPGVSLFAGFAKYLVGSIECANLTVHSGIRGARPELPPAPKPPRLDPTKVCYSFIISDGDNLPVLMYHNFPGEAFWESPVRGKLPIGWTISPSASLLIPGIVDLYVSSATPADAFLAAVSGVGYTYPDLYAERFREDLRPGIFGGFLAQTAETMKLTGLREIWIMRGSSPEVFGRYAAGIPFLQALFPDYGRRVASASRATFPTVRNVPVFRAATASGAYQDLEDPREKASAFAREIKDWTPPERPAFLHVFVHNWSSDLRLLKQTASLLGQEYVCVRPDHLAALCRQEMRRRVVWSAFEENVPCVEGRAAMVRGWVQNVSEEPVTVSFRCPRGVSVSPAQGRLEAGRPMNVVVKLIAPSERPARIAVAGAFGERALAMRLRVLRAAELLDRPPSLPMRPVYYREAEKSGSHGTGRAAEVPTASEGAVWRAEPGRDRVAHMLFGPYQPLPRGDYVAYFRIRRLPKPAVAADVPVVVLDAHVGGGKPQTGKRQLTARELPPGAWRWAQVSFAHPGGQHEVRAFWPGQAAVEIDAVALFRLEARGAKPESGD